MRIVLASQSPRRRELLERMGITEFEVIPAEGDETADPALSPAELVEELSRQKAEEVAQKVPGALVIAADTVVSVDGKVLGKPGSKAQAVEMLTAPTMFIPASPSVWETRSSPPMRTPP